MINKYINPLNLPFTDIKLENVKLSSIKNKKLDKNLKQEYIKYMCGCGDANESLTSTDAIAEQYDKAISDIIMSLDVEADKNEKNTYDIYERIDLHKGSIELLNKEREDLIETYASKVNNDKMWDLYDQLIVTYKKEDIDKLIFELKQDISKLTADIINLKINRRVILMIKYYYI